MACTATVLDSEHRALDHLLAEVEYLAERRAFGAALRRLEQFHTQLVTHLHEEEDVLAPEWVRAQQAELEAALGAMAGALFECDYNAFCDGLSALCTLLQDHEAAEEQLWPPAEAP